MAEKVTCDTSGPASTPEIALENDRRRLKMPGYKGMYQMAVRALASIDDALGVGDDGCGDTEQTLYAIKELKAAAARGEELACAVMADTVGLDHYGFEEAIRLLMDEAERYEEERDRLAIRSAVYSVLREHRSRISNRHKA